MSEMVVEASLNVTKMNEALKKLESLSTKIPRKPEKIHVPNSLLKSTIDTIKRGNTAQVNESHQFGGSSVIIGAGNAFSIPLVVYPGSEIEYSFKTDLYDVEFEVTFTPAEVANSQATVLRDEEEDMAGVLDATDSLVENSELDLDASGVLVVVEKERINSYISPEKGALKFDLGGKITFIWDNTYSWMRTKNLEYEISMKTPLNVIGNKDEENEIKAKTAQSLSEQLKKNKNIYSLRMNVCDEIHEHILTSLNSKKRKFEDLIIEIKALERKDLEINDMKILDDADYKDVLESIAKLSFVTLDDKILRNILSFGSADDLMKWQFVNKNYYEAVTSILEASRPNIGVNDAVEAPRSNSSGGSSSSSPSGSSSSRNHQEPTPLVSNSTFRSTFISPPTSPTFLPSDIVLTAEVIANDRNVILRNEYTS